MKYKVLKVAIIVLIIFVFVLGYFAGRFEPAKEFTWGLNFSTTRARELGFDPYVLYADMIADLKPAQIRLPAYWDEIEPIQNQFDFSQYDRMLDLAAKTNTKVILALGKKAPRWPECHQPGWVNTLSVEQQQEAQRQMMVSAVEHFKKYQIITIWQVENEPLLSFGDDCDKIPRGFLKEEIKLVKSLDSRPILVTDGGEMGRWLPVATTGADLFGTTMYRVIHSKYTGGYFKYPLPSWYFRIKAGILTTLRPQPILGVELQAEPWVADGILNTDLQTQSALMNPKIFHEYIQYAQSAGFGDNYLWGVEWWYWMAKTQNDWGMWTAAKDLLNHP